MTRTHGYGAYTHGCRCQVCSEAKRERQREYRSRRPGPDPTARYVAYGTTHGISGYQNHHCGCPICRGANAANSRRQYAARKRATA